MRGWVLKFQPALDEYKLRKSGLSFRLVHDDERFPLFPCKINDGVMSIRMYCTLARGPERNRGFRIERRTEWRVLLVASLRINETGRVYPLIYLTPYFFFSNKNTSKEQSLIDNIISLI